MTFLLDDPPQVRLRRLKTGIRHPASMSVANPRTVHEVEKSLTLHSCLLSPGALILVLLFGIIFGFEEAQTLVLFLLLATIPWAILFTGALIVRALRLMREEQAQVIATTRAEQMAAGTPVAQA